MNSYARVALALALLSGSGSVANAAPAPNACAAPQRHQFDFWLGNWRVEDAKGAFAGTNTVTSEYGGCVLQEHWKGAGGEIGSSFNTYLPARKKWQQTWVDSHGLTLQLYGGVVNGSMVLEGSRQSAGGKAIVDRITWTRLSDGRVRQHWIESKDGAHWSEVFDGFYRKVRA